MGALAGLNGRQRSILNLLARGWTLRVPPSGEYRCLDEYGSYRRGVETRLVDRLRQRGLITSDGRISEAGLELVSRRTARQEGGDE